MTSQLTIQDETKSQIVSQQDTMPESQTDEQKEVVYVKGFRGKVIDFEARTTNIAHCVTASKAKGIQNLGEDVILCKKK